MGHCSLLLILFCGCILVYSRMRPLKRASSLDPVATSIDFRLDEYGYVHEAFRQHNCTRDKFETHDPDFPLIEYKLKESIVWNGLSVCGRDSFVLLLFFVYRRDYRRRELIRQYIKQGMVVDGKKVRYMFVVAAEEGQFGALKKENSVHKDILISVHVDSFANLTLSILDSYLWVRNHCKQVQFIVKVDGDTWVHLGNMVHYLKSVPLKRFYGGSFFQGYYRRNFTYRKVKMIPSDYPERMWYFMVGGAYMLSRDLIPYINIGTLYIDLLPVGEDMVVGEVLRKVGVPPYEDQHGFRVFLTTSILRNGSFPRNGIFIHGLKNIDVLTGLYHNYTSSFSVPYGL